MRLTPEGIRMRWRAGGWETAVYTGHYRKQAQNGFAKPDPFKTVRCSVELEAQGRGIFIFWSFLDSGQASYPLPRLSGLMCHGQIMTSEAKYLNTGWEEGSAAFCRSAFCKEGTPTEIVSLEE